MKDNEIIKALECCRNTTNENYLCDDCPYKDTQCALLLVTDTADLINRQKAKIEALQMDNQQLQSDIANANMNADHTLAEIERLKKIQQTQADRIVEERGRRYEIASEMCILRKRLETEKSEAIKDFAERLKKTFPPRVDARCTLDDCYTLDIIDSLVKEMVCDE